MRVFPILSALAVLSVVTSCVGPPRAAVAPPPPPVRVVAPPPPAAPVVLPTDWRDWPQTPGDWRYVATAGGTVATFGAASAAFAMQCDRTARQVVLIVYRAVPGTRTVRTSAVARALSFTLDDDPPGGSVSVRLAASDPLLDAMAFSRGRFVVQEAGGAPLVLPAWAEVGRVIEDCRG